MTIRAIRTPGQPGRRPAVKCSEPGCNRSTRENKPYCPEHVESTPYVQRLMTQPEYIEEMKRERPNQR